MIKAFFIAAVLTASGGMAAVYAQAASPQSPSDASAPAGNAAAPRTAPADTKKSNDVEIRREELGKKLLKRKVELDNDKPNIQPAQAPGRARENNQEPQADQKGQKK